MPVYVTFLLLTWTPKYLQDEFHYNLSSLWYMGMIPWIGACFTVLLGKISDLLLRRTGNLKVARSWLAATCLVRWTTPSSSWSASHGDGAGDGPG